MLISPLYTRLLWPLTDRQCAGIDAKLRHGRRLERRSLADNRRRQAQALHQILLHAFDSSPFYRERFLQAGIQRGDLGQPGAVEAVPVLTRAELRAHAADICSSKFGRDQLLAAATGGTTDAPVPVYRDQHGLTLKKSVQLGFWRWAGADPGSKIFYLWGARTDYVENPGWRWHFYDRYLMRRIWGQVSRLDDGVLEGYRQQINRFRPRVLCAYPSPLVALADYLRRSGRPMHAPRGILYTAEAMAAEDRPWVGQVLRAPLFELYATRDVGTIAGECEAHAGMHLHPEAAWVEYARLGSQPEAPYELLLTDLLNYGMPIIRYRINDCVAAPPDPAAPCACGRGFPKLPPLLGRVSDVFQLPDGTLVPGVSLTGRVVIPNIVQMQVIQEGVGQFRLRYVPGPAFAPENLAALRRRLQDFLPGDLHWEIESVQAIEREASGKTRFCINRIPLARPAASHQTVHG